MENKVEKYRAKGRQEVVPTVMREKMMNEVVALLYKCTARQKIEAHILSYGYSQGSLKDLIAEATKLAAKKITKDEAELAKLQIKTLAETIMNDEDEFSMSKIKAAELLGKLMKTFQPEVAIQNNVTNNLDMSKLTPEQLRMIMEPNNGENFDE
jgi:hypothetical protein